MAAPLGESDLEAFLEHLRRHTAESGRDGDTIFMPPSTLTREELRQRIVRGWARDLDQEGWGRAWGIYDGHRIVAHADLFSGPHFNALHRSTLGIGIERGHRRRGLGRQLTETLVGWTRGEPRLHWLDLRVFANNGPAIAMYERFGFTRTGTVRDQFRIDGHSIDDITMTLWVGPDD